MHSLGLCNPKLASVIYSTAHVRRGKTGQCCVEFVSVIEASRFSFLTTIKVESQSAEFIYVIEALKFVVFFSMV